MILAASARIDRLQQIVGDTAVLRDIAHLPKSGLPNRRAFLAAATASGILTSISPIKAQPPQKRDGELASKDLPPFELSELSIGELRQGLQSGRFTARSLVESYLARIEAIDKHGPAIRSVIEVNPDALPLADQSDQERRSRGAQGPLHGIPVLVKDNIDTADKMATTAGSLALVGSTPPEDSFVVKQLRKAGAIVIGKTNLSEWSNMRSKYSTSGWSGRGGLTRNPYVLDRSPCGSSSGSAAAVAANLCAVAVGTETEGSIVGPASACGIVGIKPTVGLIGRTGIIPISSSQDTAGPMARNVRDAAILLGVLVGTDPQDAISVENAHAPADYTTYLRADGLKEARIGVARNFFGFHDAVDALMDAALDALKQAGATLIDTDDLSIVEECGSAQETLLQYEFKAGLTAYLARLGPKAPVKSLQEIIDFNDCHKQIEMPYFGQDLLMGSEERGPLSEYKYAEALARCRRFSRTEGIDAVIAKHELDALVAPTVGPACMTDLVNGDHFLGGSVCPAAVAGYPSITVPAGFVLGLPVGMSFFGRAWTECKLLRIAYAFEQATNVREAPQFLPTLQA
jgi:amidase